LTQDRIAAADGRSIVLARWCQCAYVWGHICATWWIRLNSWFLWPTAVHNPNGKLIGSAVSAGLTSVTDQQTDRPCYSVGNNRPHLRT